MSTTSWIASLTSKFTFFIWNELRRNCTRSSRSLILVSTMSEELLTICKWRCLILSYSCCSIRSLNWIAFASGLRSLCEKFCVKIVESSSLFLISYANNMFVTSLTYISISSPSARQTLRLIIVFASYPSFRHTWWFGLSQAN